MRARDSMVMTWDEMGDLTWDDLDGLSWDDLERLSVEQIQQWSRAVWPTIASLSPARRDELRRYFLNALASPADALQHSGPTGPVAAASLRLWESVKPKTANERIAMLSLFVAILALATNVGFQVADRITDPPPTNIIIKQLPPQIRPQAPEVVPMKPQQQTQDSTEDA